MICQISQPGYFYSKPDFTIHIMKALDTLQLIEFIDLVCTCLNERQELLKISYMTLIMCSAVDNSVVSNSENNKEFQELHLLV